MTLWFNLFLDSLFTWFGDAILVFVLGLLGGGGS